MARYLLATDNLIDHLAGIAGSVSMLQQLHDGGDILCVCDVVIAEIYAGLHPPDRERAQALLTA